MKTWNELAWWDDFTRDRLRALETALISGEPPWSRLTIEARAAVLEKHRRWLANKREELRAKDMLKMTSPPVTAR